MKLKHYSAIVFLLLHTISLTAQSIEVTRIDGIGAGNNFLEISSETKENILNGSFDGKITYLPDHAPIQIDITNPIASTIGNYELTLIDEDMSNDVLDEMVYWKLTQIQSGETVTSEFTITEEPEQYVSQFGITIKIKQTVDAGELGENNGAIAAQIVYDIVNGPQWLSGIPDGGLPGDLSIYNYIKTAAGEVHHDKDPNNDFTNLGDGTWVPYPLCDWNAQANNEGYLTPSWKNTSSGSVAFGNRLNSLPNIDIVFTSNKDLWSKCIVVESASEFYEDFGSNYKTEGDVEQFDIRPSVSLDKNGNKVADSSDTGFSWFPGYAINLETGKRVNIFFGENSVFSCTDNNIYCDNNSISSTEIVGGDMLWNPTNERILESGYIDYNTILNTYDGGQHMIYVTDEAYDECEELNNLLRSNDLVGVLTKKIRALRKVKWTSFALVEKGQSLLSIEDGLIPNDVTIKLRVDNPFQVAQDSGAFNGYPSYEFEIAETSTLSDQDLDNVFISPNPYFLSQGTGLILQNLPSDCQIKLYDLGGKLISLFDSPMTNGTALIKMDISDYVPSSINEGMYFLTIEKGNFSKRTLKLIVL